MAFVDQLTCHLHDVTLALSSNHPAFVAYAAEYLAPLLVADAQPPQIVSNLMWDRSLPAGKLARLGRRVQIGPDQLRFNEIRALPGLALDVCIGAPDLRVNAAYQPQNRRARWALALSPASRARAFVILIYYLVYFPWAWWLAQRRGWTLVHAGGLVRDVRGVVLCGLPGCGKSTLVWNMLARPGWRVLSDNLLFTNGSQLWACPEPLHLDARARAHNITAPTGVSAAGRDFSHQREDFLVTGERQAECAEPALVAFLHRGPVTRIRRLTQPEAFRRLCANDIHAQEWLAYQTGIAALGNLIPEMDDVERRRSALLSLSTHTCYEVTMAESQPIAEEVYRLFEGQRDMTHDR